MTERKDTKDAKAEEEAEALERMTPKQMLDYMREGHEPPVADAIYVLTKAVVVLQAKDGAAADLPPPTAEEQAALDKEAAEKREAEAKAQQQAQKAERKPEQQTGAQAR